MTRQQKRLSQVLVVLIMLQWANLSPLNLTIYAQSSPTDIPKINVSTPSSGLVGSVPSADFDTALYNQLPSIPSQTRVNTLLQNEALQSFLANHYNTHGAYGETHEGEIDLDWANQLKAYENFAKTLPQSTDSSEPNPLNPKPNTVTQESLETAIELEYLYAEWKKQVEESACKTSECLEGKLSEAFEGIELVETQDLASPETPESPETVSLGKKIIYKIAGRELKTAEDWEWFMKQRGLPLAGAAAMGLFALYRRRREEKDRYQKTWDKIDAWKEKNSTPPSTKSELEEQLKNNQEKALEVFNSEIEALKPHAPEWLEQYESNQEQKLILEEGEPQRLAQITTLNNGISYKKSLETRYQNYANNYKRSSDYWKNQEESRTANLEKLKAEQAYISGIWGRFYHSQKKDKTNLQSYNQYTTSVRNKEFEVYKTFRSDSEMSQTVTEWKNTGNLYREEKSILINHNATLASYQKILEVYKIQGFAETDSRVVRFKELTSQVKEKVKQQEAKVLELEKNYTLLNQTLDWNKINQRLGRNFESSYQSEKKQLESVTKTYDEGRQEYFKNMTESSYQHKKFYNQRLLDLRDEIKVAEQKVTQASTNHSRMESYASSYKRTADNYRGQYETQIRERDEVRKAQSALDEIRNFENKNKSTYTTYQTALATWQTQKQASINAKNRALEEAQTIANEAFNASQESEESWDAKIQEIWEKEESIKQDTVSNLDIESAISGFSFLRNFESGEESDSAKFDQEKYETSKAEYEKADQKAEELTTKIRKLDYKVQYGRRTGAYEDNWEAAKRDLNSAKRELDKTFEDLKIARDNFAQVNQKSWVNERDLQESVAELSLYKKTRTEEGKKLVNQKNEATQAKNLMSFVEILKTEVAKENSPWESQHKAALERIEKIKALYEKRKPLEDYLSKTNNQYDASTIRAREEALGQQELIDLELKKHQEFLAKYQVYIADKGPHNISLTDESWQNIVKSHWENKKETSDSEFNEALSDKEFYIKNGVTKEVYFANKEARLESLNTQAISYQTMFNQGHEWGPELQHVKKQIKLLSQGKPETIMITKLKNPYYAKLYGYRDYFEVPSNADQEEIRLLRKIHHHQRYGEHDRVDQYQKELGLYRSVLANERAAEYDAKHGKNISPNESYKTAEEALSNLAPLIEASRIKAAEEAAEQLKINAPRVAGEVHYTDKTKVAGITYSSILLAVESSSTLSLKEKTWYQEVIQKSQKLHPTLSGESLLEKIQNDFKSIAYQSEKDEIEELAQKQTPRPSYISSSAVSNAESEVNTQESALRQKEAEQEQQETLNKGIQIEIDQLVQQQKKDEYNYIYFTTVNPRPTTAAKLKSDIEKSKKTIAQKIEDLNIGKEELLKIIKNKGAVEWLVVAARQKAEELNIDLTKWENENEDTQPIIKAKQSELDSKESNAWETLVEESSDTSVDLSSLPGSTFAVNIIQKNGETYEQAHKRTWQEFSQHYIGEIADWWYGLTDAERELPANQEKHIHYHEVWGMHYGNAFGDSKAGAYGARYGEMYAPQIKDQIIKNLLNEGYEGTALKEELIKRIAAQAVAKAKAENASPYGQNLDLEVVRVAAENAVRWNTFKKQTEAVRIVGEAYQKDIVGITNFLSVRNESKEGAGVVVNNYKRKFVVNDQILSVMIPHDITDKEELRAYYLKHLRLQHAYDLLETNPDISDEKVQRYIATITVSDSEMGLETDAPYTPSGENIEVKGEAVWEEFSKSLDLGSFNSTHNATFIENADGTEGRFEVYENNNTIDSANLHVRDAYVMNRIKAHLAVSNHNNSIRASHIRQFQTESLQWSAKDIVGSTTTQPPVINTELYNSLLEYADNRYNGIDVVSHTIDYTHANKYTHNKYKLWEAIKPLEDRVITDSEWNTLNKLKNEATKSEAFWNSLKSSTGYNSIWLEASAQEFQRVYNYLEVSDSIERAKIENPTVMSVVDKILKGTLERKNLTEEGIKQVAPFIKLIEKKYKNDSNILVRDSQEKRLNNFLADSGEKDLGFGYFPNYIWGALDGLTQTVGSIGGLFNLSETIASLKALASLEKEQIFQILKESFGEYADEFRDDIMSGDGYRGGQAAAQVLLTYFGGVGLAKSAANIKSNIKNLVTKAKAVTFDLSTIKALKGVTPTGANLTNLNFANFTKGFDKDYIENSLDMKDEIAKIMKSGDPKGKITEEIVEKSFREQGYTVTRDIGKYGSNNGFDVVAYKGSLDNPSEIVIIEAKQFKQGKVSEFDDIASDTNYDAPSGTTVNKANKSTELPTQMSDEWTFEHVAEKLVKKGGDSTKLGNRLDDSDSIIKRYVFAIDKSTGAGYFTKLNNFNTTN